MRKRRMRKSDPATFILVVVLHSLVCGACLAEGFHLNFAKPHCQMH